MKIFAFPFTVLAVAFLVPGFILVELGRLVQGKEPFIEKILTGVKNKVEQDNETQLQPA